MTTPTIADLDRLDALAKAATPGPWDNGHNERTAKYRIDDSESVAHLFPPFDAMSVGTGKGAHDGRQIAIIPLDQTTRDDARFIAACNPQTVQGLISAARKWAEFESAYGPDWQRQWTDMVQRAENLTKALRKIAALPRGEEGCYYDNIQRAKLADSALAQHGTPNGGG